VGVFGSNCCCHCCCGGGDSFSLDISISEHRSQISIHRFVFSLKFSLLLLPCPPAFFAPGSSAFPPGIIPSWCRLQSLLLHLVVPALNINLL